MAGKLTDDELFFLERCKEDFTPSTEGVEGLLLDLQRRGFVLKSRVYPFWRITEAGRAEIAKETRE